MLWWKRLVVWGKDVLGAAGDGQGMGAWTRHGEGEEGGMAAEGAGDSLAPAPCPGMESTSEAELSRPSAREEGKLRQKQGRSGSSGSGLG